MAAIENPLLVPFEATCTYCGWKKLFYQTSASGLEVGSIIEKSPDDVNYNRCNRCKRFGTMQVTSVPEGPEPTTPQGFWKIPEE